MSFDPNYLGHQHRLGYEHGLGKVAALLSMVETCRRLDTPVREYLRAILPGLAEVSIQKLGELTPAAWAARNR